jgi:protein-S-isoprenylcysteine O-methyltransferase Ste14
MHPILMEILTRPVGWLAIGGSIVMVSLGLAMFLFVRRKIREEERGGT